MVFKMAVLTLKLDIGKPVKQSPNRSHNDIMKKIHNFVEQLEAGRQRYEDMDYEIKWFIVRNSKKKPLQRNLSNFVY